MSPSVSPTSSNIGFVLCAVDLRATTLFAKERLLLKVLSPAQLRAGRGPGGTSLDTAFTIYLAQSRPASRAIITAEAICRHS